MKQLLFLSAHLFLFTILTSSSCDKNKTTEPCPPETMCTMMFASVSTKVVDKEGKPVVFDEVYTVRKSTSELLKYPSENRDGYYTVVNDNYQKELANKTDVFILTGKKNGSVVMEESFEISADCCHVNKVSGKSEIILP